MTPTPTEQQPTEAERMAYEAGFRDCCLANNIPYVTAKREWLRDFEIRVAISHRYAIQLFPDHADALARDITRKLQEAYEKVDR